MKYCAGVLKLSLTVTPPSGMVKVYLPLPTLVTGTVLTSLGVAVTMTVVPLLALDLSAVTVSLAALSTFTLLEVVLALVEGWEAGFLLIVPSELRVLSSVAATVALFPPVSVTVTLAPFLHLIPFVFVLSPSTWTVFSVLSVKETVILASCSGSSIYLLSSVFSSVVFDSVSQFLSRCVGLSVLCVDYFASLTAQIPP